jgi:hypothetical protein
MLIETAFRCDKCWKSLLTPALFNGFLLSFQSSTHPMRLLLISADIMEVWSSPSNQNTLPSSDVIRDRSPETIKVLVIIPNIKNGNYLGNGSESLTTYSDNYCGTQYIPKARLPANKT